MIAGLLWSPTAVRLAGYQWDGAERELAAKAVVFTPGQLRVWGKRLLEWRDQDGAQPDDVSRPLVNELHIRRRRDRHGGTITGRFEDAGLFEAIAAVVDATAKPFDSDDDRGIAQRQAEALADACNHLLAHGDRDVLPDAGGRRPQLHVHIRLEDLEDRARAATLEFGETLTPESLRLLACDAAVIPIVMSGTGQPLDVGRATRTVPDGLHRPRPGVCAPEL